MAVTTAVTALAATTLAAMYLDARHLIRHDISHGALGAVLPVVKNYVEKRVADNKMTMFNDIDDHAKNPQMDKHLFLMFEGRTWTFRQFWEEVTRVGHWLINDLQIQRGEIVALDGGNSPEYIIVWFALVGIAAVPAFLNCNLTKGPLVHCVKIAGARILLADSDVRPLVEPVQDGITSNGSNVVWYNQEMIAKLPAFNGTELPESRRVGLHRDDKDCLMYTSGTTGFPKATIGMKGRAMITPLAVERHLGLKPGVKMYTCLPLYHGAAHGLCVTPSAKAGSTVVLSRKFSHRTFWTEVRESKADIIQYVGELCRYLVNAPPSPMDKQHNVQIVWGNGMRPDVWDLFRERFNIPVIAELYAATDGVGGSFTFNRGDFSRHTIGLRGSLWKYLNRHREKRIKIDVVTQEIVRDPTTGFAIECGVDESGETVHALDPDMEKILIPGYYGNQEAMEKRKIFNLFKKGDRWFRSGDMMRQDEEGRVYFVDRLGDTFRWKSENVSTTEVADILTLHPSIAESNVYGVSIPHTDGRAGCAAIVTTPDISISDPSSTNPPSSSAAEFWSTLSSHVLSSLPRYAVPIFIRLVRELEYTGTMKMQKGHLRGQGVDLDLIYGTATTATTAADAEEEQGRCNDVMYWLPPGAKVYIPFGRAEWEALKGGRVKL